MFGVSFLVLVSKYYWDKPKITAYGETFILHKQAFLEFTYMDHILTV
jgi:hypothetical protein